MTITFYKTTSPKQQVNKSLTNATNLNVQLKTPTDMLKPIIILGGVDLTSYNYCYIPDFNRYYYISNATTEYNNISGRECSVDVLMSHSNEIKQLNAIVERQQNFYNLYLPDLRIPNYAYKRTQTIVFPNQPFAIEGAMILAVSGRG